MEYALHVLPFILPSPPPTKKGVKNSTDEAAFHFIQLHLVSWKFMIS